MTPQERQLIDDLFDRLARVESSPRDAQAERAIAEGAQRAPHALYALVQTALVQDEALKQAEARIRELEGGDEPQQEGGGFLDSMRNAMGGGRGSVPSVRGGATQDSRWNTGGAFQQAQPASPFNAQQQPQQGGGGSFLGTAAATAAGVIGGSLLFNSLGGLFGGNRNSGSALADTPKDQGNNPWGGNDNNSAGDLSREAGANDVGSDRSAGLFDDGDQYDTADSGDFGGDFGGDGGGDA